LDLQDCGGRLSYTLPHIDYSYSFLATSNAILTFFQIFFLLPSSLTSTVTSVCSEIRCSRCGFQQYIAVDFLNSLPAMRLREAPQHLTHRFSVTIPVTKLLGALPSTYREVQRYFFNVFRAHNISKIKVGRMGF